MTLVTPTKKTTDQKVNVKKMFLYDNNLSLGQEQEKYSVS